MGFEQTASLAKSIEGYPKMRLLHIFLERSTLAVYHQFMYPIIVQHAKRYKRDDDGCIMSFFADEKSLVGARVGFFGKNLSNILSLYEVGEKDGTNSKLGDLVGFRLCGDNVVFTKLVGLMLGVVGVTVCGIADGVNVGVGLGGSVPIAVGLSVSTVGLRVRTVGLGDGCDVGLFVLGFGLGIRLGLLVGDAVIIE
jgi:hypothetical protein